MPTRLALPIAALLLCLGPASATEPTLLDTNWRATTLHGEPVPADAEITLRVGNDLRVSGAGGCNSYGAPLEIEAGRFAVDSIVATMRSCGYERNMLEQDYFAVLRAAAGWRIADGALLLLDGDDNPLVQFARQ